MNQGKLNELLTSFKKQASFSKETFQNLKQENGKQLIGYTLGDVPRELIHAASFLPVGVMGWSAPVEGAAAYLPSFCCSLMRTTLDIGMSSAAKALSGLVLGHICDTTRDFSGIWQRHTDQAFFHDWMPPKQMKRPSAKTYILAELERLKEHLESFSGRPISESNLEDSLEVYEKQRHLLKELKSVFLEKPSLLKASDFYMILKASLFSEVNRFNSQVEELLKEINSASVPPLNSMVRIVISGKIPEPMELIAAIEAAGLSIKDDDFLWGSRIIRQSLPSEGSPLERMAGRFLSSEPFPGYLYERPERLSFLMKLVNDVKADGIIFWQLKFCEPYNFDYPDLKKAFTEKGIATYLIETELQPSGIEQLKTRIQAFYETLARR